MAETQPLQVFVDKWLAAQPEMRLAEVFCPASQRGLLRAWGALLHELVETSFEVVDASVARTKLAWWAQDLGAGAGSRHPVSLALFSNPTTRGIDADAWQRLPGRALSLVASDHQPDSLTSALAELQPLAEAIAAVEGGLFGQATDARGLVVHLQLQRSLRGLLGTHPQRTRLPRDLAGDSASAPALRSYGAMLAAACPPAAGGSLIAQLRHAADGHRLRVLVSSGDPARALAIAPWRALWLAWRAGRRAIRAA